MNTNNEQKQAINNIFDDIFNKHTIEKNTIIDEKDKEIELLKQELLKMKKDKEDSKTHKEQLAQEIISLNRKLDQKDAIIIDEKDKEIEQLTKEKDKFLKLYVESDKDRLTLQTQVNQCRSWAKTMMKGFKTDFFGNITSSYLSADQRENIYFLNEHVMDEWEMAADNPKYNDINKYN